MLVLEIALQLILRPVDDQPQLGGNIVSIADYQLTRRLDFFVNVTSDSRQCLRFYKNTGSVGHDSVGSDAGALIRVENQESDLCVGDETYQYELIKVQAFDYAKSGYVHLLLSFKNTDSEEIDNFIFFRKGEEDFADVPVYANTSFYQPVKISSTPDIPLVLDYQRNFLPDLLVKTGENKYSVFKNNMENRELFRNCLKDGNTCFTEEAHSIRDERCRLRNAFYQVDLDGDCVAETYAICEPY